MMNIMDDYDIIGGLGKWIYSEYLHEHEIYTYLMKFADDDGSCMTKEMLADNGENTDPTLMNEEELFNYIRGELLPLRHDPSGRRT